MTDLSATSYVTVEGLEVDDAVVSLDGKWFDGCVFTECTLIFRGEAPFGYANTRFDRCRIRFDSHALMTLSIVSRMIPSMLDGDTLAESLRLMVSGGIHLQ